METEERAESANDSIENKLAQTEAKLKDALEQVLRQKADFDNTRKRLERDKQDAIKFANERLLSEIVPMMDHLDRALASMSEGHDLEKVKKGLLITQTEMHKVLEAHGVEVIKTAGSEFDPRFHEAVAMVPTDKFKDGYVVEEVERGYLLNGRLIRPSRVKVAQEKN